MLLTELQCDTNRSTGPSGSTRGLQLLDYQSSVYAARKGRRKQKMKQFALKHSAVLRLNVVLRTATDFSSAKNPTKRSLFSFTCPCTVSNAREGELY
jgi:hypothetical protein